jgi:DNA-directed RNA polymerase subunit beta
MAAISEKSREALHAQNNGNDKKEKQPNTTKRVRLRLIPIWLRVIMVIVLFIVCTTIGAAIGYGVLGGGKASDIFYKSTWTHVVDLVEKE